MALFGLVTGALLWLSFFRIVELPKKAGKAVVVIRSAKLNDEVAFRFPDLGGAIRISSVKQDANGTLQVQVGDDFITLDENLLIGVIKFRF